MPATPEARNSIACLRLDFPVVRSAGVLPALQSVKSYDEGCLAWPDMHACCGKYLRVYTGVTLAS